MSQYVAVCCSMLQCVAVCCSVLQRVAMASRVYLAQTPEVLQSAAVRCDDNPVTSGAHSRGGGGGLQSDAEGAGGLIIGCI